MKRSTALTLFAGGALAGANPSRVLAADSTIKIATIPIDAGAQAYFAQSEGFSPPLD